MDTIRVLSLIFFVLVVMIRATDASSRVLMGDEKPNPGMASPSPTANSSTVNKESNQNTQPKPVEVPPDTKKEPTEPPPVTKKGKGTKEGENSPNGNKNDGKQSEKNGPPKSPENPKKDDGPKADDGSAKSREDKKRNDGSREGEGPPTSKGNGEKNSEKQVGTGPNVDESHIDKSQFGTCDGSSSRCEQQDLVACLQHSKIADSKELAMIVQNAGDNTLDVNITVPPSVTIDAKKLNLAKHSAVKVNISAGATTPLKIVLDAGKGQCVIQLGSGPSISDWVQQFPAYARQLTPMYGAYFMFVVLVIAGGIWCFCKFRGSQNRADDGVAYQQIEMGTHRQSSTEIIEESAVDGWEQGWDDDWDDEEATTRPSTARPNGNVSANGLSSRSANNKNSGWDFEWDD